MSGLIEEDEPVEVHSVRELVSRRMETEGDPWRLSLVQRDNVWEPRQVAYLLDSLLFGYPIGNLLLCTVRKDGSVLAQQGELRVRRAAAYGTWQLLDGQQRLNALAWLFAGPTDPETRRFLIQLDASRSNDDVTLRKRKQENALKYIKTSEQEIEERWRWLDLSGVYLALDQVNSPRFGEARN